MLEEAGKRDHRRLGKVMDLFHFQEEAPGAVFWHPKGWSLYQNLIGYMRQQNLEAGYQEINTPELMDRPVIGKRSATRCTPQKLSMAEPMPSNR